ncbi:MAG TPA: hypothetical protein VGG54_18875 [Trebonia sp.]|jgi:hypothetical protein
MHPELLSAVVAEHHRDLHSAMTAHRVPAASTATSTATSARPRRLPRFRLSWTGTTLAAAAGNRREKSLVIIISATRSL